MYSQLLKFILLISVPVVSSWTYCVNGGECSTTITDGSIQLLANVSMGRLPEDLAPVHYNIELQPDIYTGEPPFNFNGVVEIEIDVLSPTSIIYLNQNSIDVDTVAITVSEDSPVQPPIDPTWTVFGLDDSLELFALFMNQELTVGARYTLVISYRAVLQHPALAYGLYWDSYVDSEGTTRYLVASQFQSSSARFAMPCFDEPAFKATYNVTLLRKEPLSSLSNMPQLYQEDRIPGWIADIYEQTPVMSCYLLCFVISDFDYIETVTNKGVSVRIWSRPDALYAAEFANSYAAPMLEWFEYYTGIDYPLPKLDHIALPTKLGAMENWGLSTYGEGFLLYDPNLSNSASRHLVAEVVAHETAHMWFGNLVTCVYWNHTWLNEGFANFFQFQPLLPVLGWSGDEMQVAERVMSSMDIDNLNTSVPVRIEAETSSEGGASFNSMTYNKGGAMLRMIEQIIGNETLRGGLQIYLNRFAYRSVDTDDLWEALNEQIIVDGITDPDGNPIDIKEKMDPWVNQRGHPVVTVDRDTPGVLGLNQEMFFNPDGQEANIPSPWDYLWNIPITYSSQSNTELDITTKAWNDREERIELTENIPSEEDWILLNQRYTGFYRVLYSQDDQIKLVNQLLNGYQDIPLNNRAQLITDAFHLARGNYQGEVRAMEFTRYLDQDSQYLPWIALDRNLGYQSMMLNKFNDTEQSLQGYILSIVDPVYTELGWESDNDLYTDLLREIIIRLACSFNHVDCIRQSEELYDQYQTDVSNNPIHPDQRGSVYCTAIRTGDQSDWDFAFNLYQTIADEPITKTSATYERRLLIPSMACTSDEDQMSSYLDAVYNSTIIRIIDAQSAMLAISGSDLGRPLVWQRLSDNWRNGSVPEGVDKNAVFNEIIQNFNTEEELFILNSFIDTYPPIDEAENDLYISAIDLVERNIEWTTINRDALHDWFLEYTPTVTVITDGHVNINTHQIYNALSNVNNLRFNI